MDGRGRDARTGLDGEGCGAGVGALGGLEGECRGGGGDGEKAGGADGVEGAIEVFSGYKSFGYWSAHRSHSGGEVLANGEDSMEEITEFVGRVTDTKVFSFGEEKLEDISEAFGPGIFSVGGVGDVFVVEVDLVAPAVV